MDKKYQYLTKDEAKRFFDKVKERGNACHLALFRLMYTYGLRCVEAQKLELTNIHEKLIEIRIQRAKAGTSRHFPIRPEDAKVLHRWLRERQGFPNAEGNPFIFITKRSLNGAMSLINIYKAHETYAKAIGLPREKCHPHCWRHSCAVHLLMSGAGVYDVKNWLGHTSIQTTMIYLELSPPDWSKKANEFIDKAFVE